MIETKVTWRGKESVAAVEAALRQYGRAEIRLAAEYHHVLWRCLGEGKPGAAEVLDVSGGRELLERLCAIDNLSELSPISAALGEGAAGVRVVSPSPVIYIDLRGPAAISAKAAARI